MSSTRSEHVAATLLDRAHSPDVAQTIFRDRVQQRPLVLRPTSPDPARDARSKRQHARLQKARASQKKSKVGKPRPLSAKAKRALGVHNIPKSQQKYSIYAPLNELWNGYIRHILGLDAEGRKKYVDAASAGPLLVSADYHGARMEVVRSRCVSRVGISGIVVKDTKFAFEIVTEKNELKLVPKEHTVFRIQVPWEVSNEDAGEDSKAPLLFEIHGNQFQTRAPDRANKKFRPHVDLDL
ncbi:RNase P/MRP, p29 subunit [Acrodontium crateriforme]|uniref:Ribonuclease P protein subunit n=1 Tax=Acrodontium crateriforme TaxID=150365 RepID=A0AAQ3M5B8_9PEZI|nr:RNase P/MRP, p29 subunit [Acrodontium crateriforme]